MIDAVLREAWKSILISFSYKEQMIDAVLREANKVF